MSKLTGGRWPSTLDVVDLRLPRDWTARSAVVLDRVNFVAISSDTLGRYARDLYGVSDDVLHAGLTRDFAPDVTVTVERAGMPVAFVVVEERATELWLDHMVIEPSAQGKGLGTEIVRWVQTAATCSS